MWLPLIQRHLSLLLLPVLLFSHDATALTGPQVNTVTVGGFEIPVVDYATEKLGSGTIKAYESGSSPSWTDPFRISATVQRHSLIPLDSWAYKREYTVHWTTKGFACKSTCTAKDADTGEKLKTDSTDFSLTSDTSRNVVLSFELSWAAFGCGDVEWNIEAKDIDYEFGHDLSYQMEFQLAEDPKAFSPEEKSILDAFQ